MLNAPERTWTLHEFAPVHLELALKFHYFLIVSRYFENVSNNLGSNKIFPEQIISVFWLLAHIPGPAPNAVELANSTGKKEKRSAEKRQNVLASEHWPSPLTVRVRAVGVIDCQFDEPRLAGRNEDHHVLQRYRTSAVARDGYDRVGI